MFDFYTKLGSYLKTRVQVGMQVAVGDSQASERSVSPGRGKLFLRPMLQFCICAQREERPLSILPTAPDFFHIPVFLLDIFS